jgi:hypothetical protein
MMKQSALEAETEKQGWTQDELDETIRGLLAKGFIRFTGVDESGDPLYEATDAGLAAFHAAEGTLQ